MSEVPVGAPPAVGAFEVQRDFDGADGQVIRETEWVEGVRKR